LSKSALLLLSIAALTLVPQAAAFQHFGAGCTRDDFRSGSSTVRAELCRATGASPRAVVVLHGCGGFSTFDHRLATGLPRLGISTLDVDYFQLTPPPGRKGFCGFHGGTDPFPTWMTVVHDAAAALGRAPGVDPKAVGIVGWSLGGGVALAGCVRRRRYEPVSRSRRVLDGRVRRRVARGDAAADNPPLRRPNGRDPAQRDAAALRRPASGARAERALRLPARVAQLARPPGDPRHPTRRDFLKHHLR
jgi:hypothetical protein